MAAMLVPPPPPAAGTVDRACGIAVGAGPEAADEEYNCKQIECAGCVGGVVGCLFFGGFCMAVVCGSGCIYAAKECEEGSFAGDIARSCGSFGIKANRMIRDVNEKHHVVEKTKSAATTAFNKAKQLNTEYQIVNKPTDCVKSGIKAGIEFSQEHKIVERTSNSARAVITAVAKEIGPATAGYTETDQRNTPAEEAVPVELEQSNSEAKEHTEQK